MKFTIEQLNTLSQWEEHFRTAVNAQWARNPGTSALMVIHGIFCQVTGDQRRFNDNCSHCILSLLKDCGTLYFQDKEEMEKAQAEEAARIAAQLAKEAEERSAQEQPVQEEQPSENAESAQEEQIPQEEETDKAVGISPAPAEPVGKVEIKTTGKPKTTTRKPRKPKN